MQLSGKTLLNVLTKRKKHETRVPKSVQIADATHIFVPVLLLSTAVLSCILLIRCYLHKYRITFTRFRADKYNRLYIRYVKNACNTVYRITKIINFPQSATTCLYWGRAAESIAEKRLWGLWSPYDLWCVCPMIFGPCVLRFRGSQNKRPPVGEAACLCCLWNAYSLRGVTLTYDLPAPFLQNSTVPSTRAKSV